MDIDGCERSCEGLAYNIQATMSTSSPQFSAPYCCIHRVPPLLRHCNEQAYTPVLVSIGPFHHNDSSLLPMEPHKLSYLGSFLRHSPPNMDLTSYLKIVKDLETDIRRCYAVPIALSSDDFIKMVLIDSVFIIELFRRRLPDQSLIEDYDYFYKRPFTLRVLRDIRLMENQLPFFVLVRLYTTAFRSDANLDQVSSFTDLACKFLNLKKSRIDVHAITKEAISSCHLLDLVRNNYKPYDLITDCDNLHDQVSKDIPSHVCPTVTSLVAASVRFQVTPLDGNSSNLLDIHFDKKKGILNIPKLKVVDSTEYLFRNLIGFEQFHYQPQDNYFSNYHYFLDRLINTPEDVELLAKEGIIENWLGSDKQVSDLINSLGDNTDLFVRYYNYMSITHQLISHHNK